MAEEGLKWVCFAVKNRADVSGLPMVDVGIAHVLCLFCAEKCNGGRIVGAKSWKKVEWLRYVGLDKKLSKNSERLWHFEGEDLVVDFYDAEAERRMVAKREAQRANAKKKWSGDATGDAMGYAMADANGMPTECHGDAMGLLYKDKKDICKAEREVRGSSTVRGGAGGGAARSLSEKEEDDEGFGRWLAEFAAQLPWLAEYRVLPREVAEAAREAYEALPAAPMGGMAELMGAYYASRLEVDSYRHKFWRPRGGRFFKELGDVMQHAERWDRETGWGAKRRRHAEAVERQKKAAKAEEAVEGMSEEEVKRFFADIRDGGKEGEGRKEDENE